ncbi:FtsX-like permease family protein [uncultured Helicobacter sp.]|uniref:FtsX-like permease family protein n=1 Tax=uncultured Helicobacter sp. TaxID=175537 RepID=UPI00374FA4F1
MSSIKRHLALIIPLLALLFGIESIMLINRSISTHEQKLANSYSIIIASKEALDLQKVQTFVREAEEIKPIAPDYMINELKKELSKDALQSLQKELPLFYSLRLAVFPDKERLEQINSTLLKLSGVTKVESFSKSHSQVYKLLLIIKGSVIVFSILSAILSCLLMVKQIEVWKFEHSERMEIMSFLGAPSWMRNSILFRLAVVDSVLVSVMSLCALHYFKASALASDLANTLEVSTEIIKVWSDSIILLLCSLIISLVCVCFVILKQRDL